MAGLSDLEQSFGIEAFEIEMFLETRLVSRRPGPCVKFRNDAGNVVIVTRVPGDNEILIPDPFNTSDAETIEVDRNWQQAQILRYHHVEKWRANTIAHQLGVHHHTVQCVVARSGLVPHGPRNRPSQIEAYLPFIIVPAVSRVRSDDQLETTPLTSPI